MELKNALKNLNGKDLDSLRIILSKVDLTGCDNHVKYAALDILEQYKETNNDGNGIAERLANEQIKKIKNTKFFILD
ncbi:MAG: hypothetical protein ACOCRX_08710 [Candidatus Woesearchaeota archaeon]